MLAKLTTVTYGANDTMSRLSYTIEAMLDIDDMVDGEYITDVIFGKGSLSLKKTMEAIKILNREGMRVAREMGQDEGEAIPDASELMPIDFMRIRSAAWDAAVKGMERQVEEDEVDATLSEINKKKE